MAETTIQILEAMEAARRRSEYVDAVYKTGTVLGLGGLLYFGWWLYDFTTNISIDLRNKIGIVAPVDFPPVNPWLASEEAAKAYEATLAAKPSVTGIHSGALLDALKARDFRDAQRFIDAETGAFTGYTTSYYMVKKAEEALVKSGDIPPDAAEPMHPVDQISRFVLHDKWYWGGVLGLASIPSLALAAETIKETTRLELRN